MGRSVEAGDAVEHHGQADLELVAEVVAGLEHVLAGELDEARVLVGGHLLEDLLGEFGHVLGAVERQGYLLQDESVHVGVEDGHGVGDRRVGEPGLA